MNIGKRLYWFLEFKKLIKDKIEEKEIISQKFQLKTNREIEVTTTFIDKKEKKEVFHF